MRLLLDTHAFFWWFSGNSRLSLPARQAIEDDGNDVMVSAASAWEIATKHRLGKLPGAEALVLDITGAIAEQNFMELPITVEEAARAGALPGLHRDPFDRMLIAQALARNLVLISSESLFDRYGVRRLW
ncbi:MAG: type II toxin-antitoxin system VapC family toxin [Bryobacterales bacterium]|nr:type II toxin-antitoxin system VapC family toxin [Bryobacterales bacterium]MDE0294076.1 type II toxin-antitoxin system VapC family toxin [Bryobacterales bacterium]